MVTKLISIIVKDFFSGLNMSPVIEKLVLGSFRPGKYKPTSKLFWSHGQLKICFCGTRSCTILKLGMDHRGLKVYNVYGNDEPGLTLTYLTARLNLFKLAYCTYTRPRCNVSVYRAIGPLV